MNREEVNHSVQSSTADCVIISIPTGFGKSRISLDATYNKGPLLPRVLVVYPKKVNKEDWKKEYIKWGYERHLVDTTFTTYNSLHKQVNSDWDVVIFDEGHHITDRVADIIKVLNTKKTYILSATIPYTFVNRMKLLYKQVSIHRVKVQEAITEGILPDPKIVLIPLQFNTVDKTELIVKNPKASKTVQVLFQQRHSCSNKSVRYEIPCTEAQYYMELDSMVDWYKRRAMSGIQVMKNLWLHKAGERLKWLASKKSQYVLTILQKLKNTRTLTFCGTIEQTELLGKNCIHSKNKDSQAILQSFNDGNINHITAVAMLDEGINLVNCQVGIFANINSSDRIQLQRTGRILRHKEPIIIIPYFKNSREEEIVNTMIEGYNKDLIEVITDIKKLKL